MMQNDPLQRDSVLPTNHPLTHPIHTPPDWWRGRRFANILFLSIGFMFISTAYYTSSAIANSVIHDMRQYGFQDGDGYTSLAILYSVQLAVTPIVPLVIKILGGKWSMIVGGVGQLLYVCTFELNSRLLLFIVSGVSGFAMNLFWSGNGVIFTSNTSATTANKFAGIFWVLYNFSQIWGNIVVAVKFSHLDVIDDNTRRFTFGALIIMVLVGCIVFLFIKEEREGENILATSASSLQPASINNSYRDEPLIAEIARPSTKQKLWDQSRTTFRLIASTPMLLSIGYFAFTGYNLTIYTSPIPTAVGFNKHFGDARKELIGITGFCTGAAEIVGGLFLIFFSNHVSRTIVWSVGTFLSAIAMGLSALNMPLNATVEDSSMPTILFGNGSSVTICIVCSILFGLSDSATSISMIAVMSDVFGHEHDVIGQAGVESSEVGNSITTVATNTVHSEERSSSKFNSENNHVQHKQQQQLEQESSATAFAVLNGTQSIVSAILFFSSSYIWLNWYFYALVPVCIWSSIGHYFLDRNFRAGRYQNYFQGLAVRST